MLRSLQNFLLYDWQDVAQLTQRQRYQDHSRETFDAVLDSCDRIAREKYAPFNRLVDTQEPHFDGEKVHLPQATHDAHHAYVNSGMLAANQDYEIGGMQLPFTVSSAANATLAMASVGIGSHLLTVGNAGLLMKHGSDKQKQVFAHQLYKGLWAGTMCLSEPQAGSSLSDIQTKATPDGDDFAFDPLGPRYRLKGNKMWISSGDHELTQNIVHLVLAKVPGPDGKLIAGTRGISLFIVPKHIVGPDGSLTGQRNDVALAGLNHKLGWRGTTNTLLNFGEGRYPVTSDNNSASASAGAIGYLVGNLHQGLMCMFHMMNEARIAVGSAAAMLGLAGYYASLDYAKNRPQGRSLGAGGKDPSSPQIAIIEHADVKRMLLAQKSYCEGAFALEIYCAKLVDEQHTNDSPELQNKSRLLLEILTPIAKSWPSEWCLEANSLAIQIHGGYGYTRDFPVEQYWRDNRLNMIHEGTHGIQAQDLLGRKVLMEKGAALALLDQQIAATIQKCQDLPHAQLNSMSEELQKHWQEVLLTTQSVWQDPSTEPAVALANAVPYMQAFGHVVLAWIWLDLVHAIHKNPDQCSLNKAQQQGKMAAAVYFFNYELPKIHAWLKVVKTKDSCCALMASDQF